MIIRKIQLESYNGTNENIENYFVDKWLVYGHNDLLFTEVINEGSIDRIYEDILYNNHGDLIQNFYLIKEDDSDEKDFWNNMKSSNFACLYFININNIDTYHKIPKLDNLMIYETVDNYNFVIAVYGDTIEHIQNDILELFNTMKCDEIFISDTYKLFFSYISKINSDYDYSLNVKMSAEISVSVKNGSWKLLKNIKDMILNNGANIRNASISLYELSGSSDFNIFLHDITVYQFFSLFKNEGVFSFLEGYNYFFTCNTKIVMSNKNNQYEYKKNINFYDSISFEPNEKNTTFYDLQESRIYQYMNNTIKYNIPDYGFLSLYFGLLKFMEKVNDIQNKNDPHFRVYINYFMEYAREIMNMNQSSQIGYYTKQEYACKEIYAPTKLITFYTAFVYFLNNAIILSENDFINKKPSFIFCLEPSIADNVYTSILFSNDKLFDDRLLIVNIPMDYIYNYKIMLFSLCHEAIHYCGEYTRCRKERAQFIVHACMCDLIELILKNIKCDSEIRVSVEEKIIELFKDYFMETKTKFNNCYYLTDLKELILKSINYVLKTIILSSKSIIGDNINYSDRVIKFLNLSIGIKNNCIDLLINDIPYHLVKSISELFSETYADFYAIHLFELSFENYLDILKKTYGAEEMIDIKSDYVTLRILSNYFALLENNYVSNDFLFEGNLLTQKEIFEVFINNPDNKNNQRLSEHFLSPEILEDVKNYLCICKNKIDELPRKHFSKIDKVKFGFNQGNLDLTLITNIIEDFRKEIKENMPL